MIHPNFLTVFRILLAFLFPPFMISPHFSMRFLAFWVFLVAALSDLWDGALARKTNRVTDAGKILDPVADKLLNLGAMATYAHLGAYPAWLLVPIFIREILITLIRIRLMAKREVLAAELSGKIKTTIQYVSIGLSYFYLMALPSSLPSFWLGILYGLNLMGIIAALGMTLYSGYLFFREKGRLEKAVEALATCGYMGYLPVAPGTWGSLAGALFFLALPLETKTYVPGLLLLIALAVWASGKYQSTSRAKDPGEVVADEFVGILTTYCLLPKSWIVIIAGFLLFRLLDIVKPLFVRKLESLPGGWGIVLDDLLAGVYANLVLRGILWILHIPL